MTFLSIPGPQRQAEGMAFLARASWPGLGLISSKPGAPALLLGTRRKVTGCGDRVLLLPSTSAEQVRGLQAQQPHLAVLKWPCRHPRQNATRLPVPPSRSPAGFWVLLDASSGAKWVLEEGPRRNPTAQLCSFHDCASHSACKSAPAPNLCFALCPCPFIFTSKFSSPNGSPPGEAGARAVLGVCRGCSLQLCNISSHQRKLALPFFFFPLSNRIPSHFSDTVPFFPRCSQPAELLSPTIFLPVQRSAQRQPRARRGVPSATRLCLPPARGRCAAAG